MTYLIVFLSRLLLFLVGAAVALWYVGGVVWLTYTDWRKGRAKRRAIADARTDVKHLARRPFAYTRSRHVVSDYRDGMASHWKQVK